MAHASSECLTAAVIIESELRLISGGTLGYCAEAESPINAVQITNAVFMVLTILF
jgi:hypothetical protein